MNAKTVVCLFCLTGLLMDGSIAAAAHKKPRRAHHTAAHSSAKLSAKPYGAGLNEEQSLSALASEISRKLGSSIQADDYPDQARREGWSGTTRVDVQVGSDGKIKQVSVQQSSGFELLDEHAVRMVDRIKLWWIPQRLRNREVTVTVPVGFYIRDEPERLLLSEDAIAGIRAERVYLAATDCRDPNATDSGLIASIALDFVAPAHRTQESTLDGWTAAHSLW